MKIPVSKVGKFDTPLQAKVFDRCQEIMTQTKGLMEDLVSLDNSPVDRDQTPGRVLLESCDIQKISGREPQKFRRLPTGGSAISKPGVPVPKPKEAPTAVNPNRGEPIDELYLLEKKASGYFEFDPVSKQGKDMEMEPPRHQDHSFCYNRGKAFFGGETVETFQRFDNFSKDSYYRETVTLNTSTGTLTYQEKLVDRRGGDSFYPAYPTLLD